MKEIRAIISDTEVARGQLQHEQAIYRGDYAFTDHIYSTCHFDTLPNWEKFFIPVA